MHMKSNIINIANSRHIILMRYLVIFLFLILSNSCIVQFIPDVPEVQELLVVEGMITDQPGLNMVKLSTSLPLGDASNAKPVTGCSVNITDDLGSTIYLGETEPGTYITYAHGIVGRTYTLHINRSIGARVLNYESSPMEMIPVPPIDSIYYEKEVVRESWNGWFGTDACKIYLDTHDPSGSCSYYRWTFSETWILRLLFPVPNGTCWITEDTKKVNVKNASSIKEAMIVKQPINYITNVTDRLKIRYSILVNQYSLTEEEYAYWDKAHDFVDQVGGLYDIIPSSIPNNLWRVGVPQEKVLGYFSVSAVSSKRIFIQDNFQGIIDQYPNCINDTIYGDFDPPELNVYEWTLIDHPEGVGPRERVLTYRKECADCTTRGTTVKPDFWIDGK
jgi:hypothetical protein